ncbi:MAG: helix-turn-helix domain-containing protein [candidate division NC10 bacterium]|nr:helix-turn-helix domain-containing protein [candidate division NC10 bacterium]
MAKVTNYPEIYTVEEFAKIFKLSPEAVRSLIRKGDIPAIRIGKQYRIPQNVVDRYFAQAASPEELGFGMWKDRPVNSLEYINKVRNKDNRTPQEFLQEMSGEDE